MNTARISNELGKDVDLVHSGIITLESHGLESRSIAHRLLVLVRERWESLRSGLSSSKFALSSSPLCPAAIRCKEAAFLFPHLVFPVANHEFPKHAVSTFRLKS